MALQPVRNANDVVACKLAYFSLAHTFRADTLSQTFWASYPRLLSSIGL
jgi:hypothetical protein